MWTEQLIAVAAVEHKLCAPSVRHSWRDVLLCIIERNHTALNSIIIRVNSLKFSTDRTIFSILAAEVFVYFNIHMAASLLATYLQISIESPCLHVW
jgi:hypothetical protein